MFRDFVRLLLDPARRADTSLSVTHSAPCPGPVLPAVARHFLPEATGQEAEAFNRSRVATAVALHLYRHGYREDAPTAVIDAAVYELGWKRASSMTHAAVRAALAVVRLDPGITRDH